MVLERNVLRDKTLVLRILDERLQSHLREKMAALDENVNQQNGTSNNKRGNPKASGGMPNPMNIHNKPLQNASGSTRQSSSSDQASRIFDLEGVTCEPAIQSQSSSSIPSSLSPQERAEQEIQLLDQHTLWTFHCDGATYPARLTNLPCPIEIHKTHDHAMYYKCVDVAQMLIVYEDMTALEEAESMPGYSYRAEGYPSYYHSGLTPPMSKVVQRRYMEREHHCDAKSKPPMSEVMEVEKSLIEMIEAISTKDPNKRQGRGNHSAQRSMQTKVLEEVEDEVVEYEPWMDRYGQEPGGIEFDETDPICKQHPEVWLDSEELKMPTMMEEVYDAGNASVSGGDKKGVSGGGKKGKGEKKPKKPKKSTKKKKNKKADSPVPEQPLPAPVDPIDDEMITPDITDLDKIEFDLGMFENDSGGDEFGFDFDEFE